MFRRGAVKKNNFKIFREFRTRQLVRMENSWTRQEHVISQSDSRI